MPLRLLFAILAAVYAAAAQQGTADAFVAKIPGANIPSSVILSVVAANGLTGRTVTVPIALSLGGSTAPGSFQFDLSFDTTKLTFVSASGLSSSIVLATGAVRLSTAGNNPAGIASGVVGSVSFAVSESFGAAATTVNLVNCISADPSGNPLSTGCIAGEVGPSACAVTGDGTAGVTDVQSIINQALGIAPPTNDLNQDGVVNVADIEWVLTAAMGAGCAYQAG